MASWTAWHKKLWPAHDPPQLLVPLSGQDAQRSAENPAGFFLEATLPTSYLISSVVHQASNPRTNPKYRLAASMALYHVLEAVLKTGGFKLTWPDTGLLDHAVPVTGAVSSDLLRGLLPAAASTKFSSLWEKDSKDVALNPLSS